MEIKTDKQRTLKRKRKKSNEAKGMQKKNGVCFLFANYSWARVPV